MKKEYHKLIRDRIPEIIAANGQSAEIRILSDAEYTAALEKKLTEEVAEYLESKYDRKVASLSIEIDEADPEYVGLTYTFVPVPFERIRRITGYLVGSMDNWNDAKAAEEADRVKHGLSR